MLITGIQQFLLAVFWLNNGLTQGVSDSRKDPQIQRARAPNSPPNNQDQGSFRIEEMLSKTNILLEKLIAIQENANQKLDNIIRTTAVDRRSLNSKLDKILHFTESKTTQDHTLAVAQDKTNEKLSELIEKTDINKYIVPRVIELVQMQKSLNPTLESNNDDYASNITKLHRFLHSANRKLMGTRPKRDISKPIIVILAVNVYQIIEMNEPEEYLRADIHLNMTFYNEFLGWNPSDFGQITTTELKFPEKMWIPDIFAYNGMDMRSKDFYFEPVPRITTAFDPTSSVISSTTATVEYSYPRIVKFSCSFDTFYFPFDYQLCVLVFRSWAHSSQKIYIVAGEHGKDYTKPNDEWDIENMTQKSSLVKEKSSGKLFSVYQEEILMKRRPLYYIANLIIPSIIITQVAFFGFFSPSSSEGDRTEKVNLGMGTLLAMSVLLLTVCGMTPVTSSYIPLMGIFFLGNMLLISLGVGVTTFIMAVHQRGKRKKRVPRRIQTFFFFKMAPLLGLKIPTIIRQDNNLEIENITSESVGRKPSPCEPLLLEQIPQVKQLSEHFESMITNRRRALAEVEYIFLAKILDGLMLLIFSILLYVCIGCVTFFAIRQHIPTALERQPMQWWSEVYTDKWSRLDDEFIELLDMNKDGTVDRSEFIHLYGRIYNKNTRFFDHVVPFAWPEFNEPNGNMTEKQLILKFKTSRAEHGIAPYDFLGALDFLAVFDEFDLDSDSGLDQEEFTSFCNPSTFSRIYRFDQPFLESQEAYDSDRCNCWFWSSDLDGNGKTTAIEQLIAFGLILKDIEPWYGEPSTFHQYNCS